MGAFVQFMQVVQGYIRLLPEFYGVPTNPVQKQLARLESDGVILNQLI